MFSEIEITHKGIRTSILALICCLLSLNSAPLSADIPREYRIKAAFLVNFLKFTKWPTDIEHYNIGLLGPDPFKHHLEKLARGFKKKSVNIRHFDHLQDVNDTHLLFIHADYPLQRDDLLAFTQNHSVLTVSDNDDFIEHCGIIRMYTKKRKIRFEINHQQALQQHITLSAKLLKLATIVEEPSCRR